MKTFNNKLWMLAILLCSTFAFTSCMDEDDEIGYTISGHWFGDMDMYYNGERSVGSEIEFYSNYGYDRGTGVEIDYYRYHAVTTYFNWQVRNRVLYLTYEDPALDCAIVDYRLSYDYFSGYIADFNTLENLTSFRLRNYDRYWDAYGYGGYDYYGYDYYDYYVKGARAAGDSIAAATPNSAVKYHGIRGVNMKKENAEP